MPYADVTVGFTHGYSCWSLSGTARTLGHHGLEDLVRKYGGSG
jgi:hypothetical protein